MKEKSALEEPTTPSPSSDLAAPAVTPEVVGLPAAKRAYTPARSPFKPFDLEAFLLSKSLPAEAEEFIRAAVAARSRHANGYRSNTIIVPMETMGYAATAESRGYEYPALLITSMDPKVKRVWEQLPRVTFNGVGPNGKVIPFATKLDLLIIYEDGTIEVIEVKSAAEMAKLCVTRPNRYKCVDGIYRSLPAEEFFAAWGMRYRIVTEFNYRPPLVQAARFLHRYVTGLPATPITEDERNTFIAAAKQSPGIRVSEIPAETPKRRAEIFYHLVATGDIFTNLSDCNIVEPHLMRVFPTATDVSAFELFRTGARRHATSIKDLGILLRPGSLLELGREEFEVVKVSKTFVLLRNDDGGTVKMENQALLDLKPLIGRVHRADKEFQALFSQASIEDRIAYYRRRIIIEPYIAGGELAGQIPKLSTHRTWLRDYLDEGDRALLPKLCNSGNRPTLFGEEIEKVMMELLEKRYCAPGKKETLKWVYLQLVGIRNERKLTGRFPALRAFYRRAEKFNEYMVLYKRYGKRFALKAAPIWAPSDIVGSVRGQRDFQDAHLDSTVEDLAIDHPDADKRIIKRHITFLVDSYTGEILACARTKGPVCGETIRLLVLDCLNRHGALPATIICDWGSEHRTTWLAQSLLRLGVKLHFRPKSTPRNGAPVESAFSVAMKTLYHCLEGTTALLKNARQVTKAVDPRGFTVWTDEAVEELLEEYIYLKNHLERTGSPSPVSVAAACRKRLGDPPKLPLSLEDVRLELLPYVARRKRMISKRGEVQIGDKRFASEDLCKFGGKRADVRQDPDFPDKVFVNPPNRTRVIEATLINFGGPTPEIIEDAKVLDTERLGASSTPGVSRSDEILGDFAKKTEETQQRLKEEKAERSSPPPAPRPAPPAPDLKPLPTVPRLNHSTQSSHV